MLTQNGKCACACNDSIEIFKMYGNKLLLHVILNHTKFGFLSKKEISYLLDNFLGKGETHYTCSHIEEFPLSLDLHTRYIFKG